MSEPTESGIRCAAIYQQDRLAGYLKELPGKRWSFDYLHGYNGIPISLILPVRPEPYEFDEFPAVFEGLLPEGMQLEALLRRKKIDRHDLFGQLIAVGEDLVGSVTVKDSTR